MKKQAKEKNPRLGKVGGEAVLEGVMMRCGEACATACRTPDGEIAVVEQKFVSARKKHKICNFPIIRGVVSFVESMKLSMSTLNVSAEMMGIDEEMEESKFEKWLKKTFGKSIYDFVTVIGLILGFALAIGLFFFLPNFLANLINDATGGNLGVWKAAVASGVKIVLFILYIVLISLMKDIRRTFQYHGAEHKSIACFEAGVELTPENAKNYRRFHPRCGTSFMFVMIFLGLVIAVCIRVIFEIGFNIHFAELTGSRVLEALIYTGIGLCTLPIVMGLGFEFLMFAGRHDNWFTRALSAPGMWMQRLTTKEPDLSQLECAITALKCAMPDEFPDFDKSAYLEKGRRLQAIAAGERPETAASGEAEAPEETPAEPETPAPAGPEAAEAENGNNA